ncbi:hypothetical protein ACFMPD_07820 [Sedimentitalea sp. HM32M-2]|uniref:hypothetical protein n=1 Tax=Sedimentitalea sp. HM32M-2 TaxID=3351566 RepID=UPI00362A44A7
MTYEELKMTAESMERQIAGAAADQRLALQPQFARVLDRMAEQGEPVPARLRRLEAALVEEVIEARFDNMPV